MSKADKLFYQEGYKHIEQVDNLVKYEFRYPSGKDYVIIDGDSEHVEYKSSTGDAIPFSILEATYMKIKELDKDSAVAPIKKEDKEFGKDLPEEFADEVWYNYHCGNEDCPGKGYLVPWDNYCSECGTKIAWGKYKVPKGEV